jgi:hypothetical protein
MTEERGGGASHNVAQRQPSTSSWPNTRKPGSVSGGMKTGQSGILNWTVWFPRVRPAHLQLGAHLASDLRPHNNNIQKVGSVTTKIMIQCLTFLWATNAWAVRLSTDDVPTLSSLGGVVQSMGATTDILPPGMVKIYLGCWPWRLLHGRWLLRTHQPSAGHRSFRAGKSDSSEYQTRPSS